MSRHFVHVFGTMLALPAVLSKRTEPPVFALRVSSSVGFAGENIVGAIFIHYPEPLARRSAAAMRGLALADALTHAEINAAVGGLSNLLAGGLKSWLCDAGAVCALGAPAIIRGKAFTIEPMPDVERKILVFECGYEFVVVDIYLRLN